MSHSRSSRQAYRWVALALCAALLAGMLAAASPQAAKAVTCVLYYYVKKGDTTPRISHTFGLKWKQIAVANDLEEPYKLTIGQRLCIPPKDFDPEPEEKASTSKTKMTVTGLGNWVKVTAPGFSQTSIFYVKVRPSDTFVRGWYKIGLFKVSKNKENSETYRLPSELSEENFLSVCLKNATTDELLCRNIYNP
jgi:LysM repeat protein